MNARLAVLVAFAVSLVGSPSPSAEPISFDPLSREYQSAVRPLLVEFCITCHSTEKVEGELDLEKFARLEDIRRLPREWQKVVEMLENREMPPEDAKPITDLQRKQLIEWAERYLEAEGRANAGDPGPVILRRLSNVEYDRTVRDLTGVDLRPAREFPGDGAAGEGFTNAGEALVMSPALLEKYLAAGKEIATHAVLLPDGIRFSTGKTRRDWTNELVEQIRQLYARYTDPGGARRVNLQGLNFEADAGGRIPLESYLHATLEHRAALVEGKLTIADLAAQRQLSEKYLNRLWQLVHSDEAHPNPLFEELRQRWRTAQPSDAPALAEWLQGWQTTLTKFNSVAHFKPWMEAVDPLKSSETFRSKFAVTPGSDEVVVRFTTRSAGDGKTGDLVEWVAPRLEMPGREPILLRDLRKGLAGLHAKRATFANAADYLAAADAIRSAEPPIDVRSVATERKLDPAMLVAWLSYLGIETSPARIETLLAEKLPKVGGFDFVQGWGVDLPNIVANASDEQVRIPGILKPHHVAVHPTPTLNVIVGWRSPVAGGFTVSAEIQHAHPECGNGLHWAVQLRRGAERRVLAEGDLDRAQGIKPEPIADLQLRAGDLVSLLIGPRGSDHSCDLTDIDFTIRESGPTGRTWSLARDTAKTLMTTNPRGDQYGHEAVWHFYHEPVAMSAALAGIPPMSALDRWRSAPDEAARRTRAGEVQKLLAEGPPANAADPDAELYRQLTAASGPLLGLLNLAEVAAAASGGSAEASQAAEPYGLADSAFGRGPDGQPFDAASLLMTSEASQEIRIPAELAAGREFVVDARLANAEGPAGSVQVSVEVGKSVGEAPALQAGLPVLVPATSPAEQRFQQHFAEFRELFPAAVCYPKIVPVDEVVTLVQFHRDDERLGRLMLDDAEQAKLNRLWEELRYVSQDAFKVREAYGQFMEYVTQDGDVRLFEPLRKPIAERAEKLQGELLASEPKHIDALVALARRAYRRPLTDGEAIALRELYQGFRAAELSHADAIQWVVARILVAPTFLYRAEVPNDGERAAPVSNHELASRLSYFLWSSMPDDALSAKADAGELHDPEILVRQARRMLQSEQVRALASEFACQWLDIRGFDTLDEKNEQLFPDFAELRGPMYEESLRFFTTLFQENRSVLEILDADYVFVNESLARHYGLPFPESKSGSAWQRIEGVQAQGRGGILGMAATLAKHSGASRTSPVLRGNWVSEFLLGERLPRPPKDVPQLPETEQGTERTVRELVEKHREVAACAKCHDRIDPLGFALEAFDTVGRRRDVDVAGRPIDTKVQFKDGITFDGVDGLRDYLLTTRREQFLHQFCKKLLGYALGRGVMISDEPLIEEMMQKLESNDYRFGTAVEVIVRSPQFQQQRPRAAATTDL